MKRISGLIVIAAVSGFSIAAHAQVIVISDNFDSRPLGPFGDTYQYQGSAANPSAAIVTPGANGTGQALQFSVNLPGGADINTGLDLPSYIPSGNTSADLSDYTLSFDLAITGSDMRGFFLILNVFGPDRLDGAECRVGPPFTAGSGFRHISVNMGTLGPSYSRPLLDPSGNQYNFQLVLIGAPEASAAPETVILDNLRITMKTNAITGTGASDAKSPR